MDTWETLVGHMERMQKRMESMGPGIGPHNVNNPSSPPPDKKPE